MKFKPEKKYFHIGLTIFLTAIAIMAAYFLFFRIDSIKEWLSKINKIMAPVFYGFILAYLMAPLLNAIERKFVRPLFEKEGWFEGKPKKDKNIRTVSVVLTLLIVIMVLYLFFVSVIPQLSTSISTLVSQYSVYTNNLVEWFNSIFEKNPEISKALSGLVESNYDETKDFLNDMVLPALKKFGSETTGILGSGILSSVTDSIFKIISFLWNIIIGLVISIYVLAGKEKFIQGSTRICYAFLERTSANKFIDSIRFMHHTFINFLSGKVLDSFIIGVLCYICCLIMKMPFPLLISVIVGVTNIIPFFGPFIGAVPSTLIILLVDPKKAITFIIFIIILQQVDGNIIGPKILSQSTGVTSFWIIFSITLFGGLWGIIGMIIGVPITAVLISFIDRITKNKLSKKNLPEEPEPYLSVGSITEEGVFNEYVYHKPEKKKIDKNSNGYKFLSKCCTGIKNLFIKLADFLRNKFDKNK